MLSEKDYRWNRFIQEVCFRDIESLSNIQKKAVLCFWYDAEMNSGGHSGYFDCYPNTVPEELINAIDTIMQTDVISRNYIEAIEKGESDCYVKTDMTYNKFRPSLSDLLMEYVEMNKGEIFGEQVYE